MYTTHSNVSTNTKKTGLVVLAHGKMLNTEELVTMISAYDASIGCEKILEHLKDEFAKMGAEPTAVGFSEPMDLDFAILLADMKSRAIDKCLSA